MNFICPPLQILASCINFCTLILSNEHLFQLPFKSYQDILSAKELFARIEKSDDKKVELKNG